MARPDRAFWAGQRVLLTGHTGFKGAWAAMWLGSLGAQVQGYALAPDQVPDLYSRILPVAGLASTFADLSDKSALETVIATFRPTLALHMAAQPLVRRSYAEPAQTFATNVLGTVNLLEALRGADALRAVLVVTTDKVYRNDGTGRPFVETDRLGGHDPYSASKACAELVVESYRHSFFAARGIALAAARAGNVIGGGDWSADRLVPDVWRARHAGRPLELRNPAATRPWQHVLDSLAGYLVYLEGLARGADLPPALNFGPLAGARAITVAEVAEAVASEMGGNAAWVDAPGEHPPEMPALQLDATLAGRALGWRPRLDAADALRWTAEWYRAFDAGAAPRQLCLGQLRRYEDLE